MCFSWNKWESKCTTFNYIKNNKQEYTSRGDVCVMCACGDGGGWRKHSLLPGDEVIKSITDISYFRIKSTSCLVVCKNYLYVIRCYLKYHQSKMKCPLWTCIKNEFCWLLNWCHEQGLHGLFVNFIGALILMSVCAPKKNHIIVNIYKCCHFWKDLKLFPPDELSTSFEGKVYRKNLVCDRDLLVTIKHNGKQSQMICSVG